MRRAECVGTPIKAVVFGNSHGVLARSPQGRHGMFYIPYYSTTGGALTGFHPGSGETVEIPLGASGGYGCCVGRDGALYIGGVNPGNLYRYDPAGGELRCLGGAETGASYIWAVAAAPDGKIYGACYPTCNVVEYDPARGTLRDLGRMVPGEQYARSICVDPFGNVWVGIGTHAHLVVCDPRTGDRRDVLPERYRSLSSCYDLAASGPFVAASVEGNDAAVVIYDARTRAVVAEVPRPPETAWWMNTRGAPPGHVYLYTVPDGHLCDVEVETGRVTTLREGLGQCELVDQGRFVHAIQDQDYVCYDLQEQTTLARKRLASGGDGMDIYTLAAGRDGNIYGSTYINQHMFRYSPATGALEDLGKVIRVGGQVDSMAAGPDGRIYMGAYVMAHLAVYDPARPWAPGRDPAGNPRELGALGHGQYRTCAITLGPDGRIWVGSIPSYNSGPCGAFSMWDPATGEHRTWTDLVPGGAVHRVAADDRYLYCAGAGLFFVWDPRQARKVHQEERPVRALAACGNGTILGASEADLFAFDPETMRVKASLPAPAGPVDYLAAAPNGKVYGINQHSVIEFDPAAATASLVAHEGGKLLAVDQNNVLYFARGSKLFRMR